MDSGTNWQGTYTTKAIVNASDLTCFTVNGKCPTQPQVEQIQAHLYGEIASGYQCRTYKYISEVLYSDSGALFYCNQHPHQQEYALRFSVINPQDPDRVYPRFTDRIITASSGQCYQYNITDGSNQPALDPNGDNAAVSWAYSNGTVNGTITIPTEYSGQDSTTYIYPGTQIPQNETEYSCGPRCMWIWAWKSNSTLPFDKGEARALIKCPITVSPVTNVTEDSQIVSDGTAKLAASAIGLQGRSSNPPQNNFTTTWRQYQFYPWGCVKSPSPLHSSVLYETDSHRSRWEIHDHRLDEVGANMASFALGSLAWMATTNPTFGTEGLVPILGYRLSVHWDYVIALCACIVGIHFALFAAAVYTSRLVIIKDDNFLSTARLLKPLVEHLGPRATFLGGRELSDAIEEFVPGGVVYGPREDGPLGGTALDLGEQVLPRRRLNNRRHLDGRYL